MITSLSYSFFYVEITLGHLCKLKDYISMIEIETILQNIYHNISEGKLIYYESFIMLPCLGIFSGEYLVWFSFSNSYLFKMHLHNNIIDQNIMLMLFLVTNSST